MILSSNYACSFQIIQLPQKIKTHETVKHDTPPQHPLLHRSLFRRTRHRITIPQSPLRYLQSSFVISSLSQIPVSEQFLDKNPNGYLPDLGTSSPGGTLTYQSGKIPSSTVLTTQGSITEARKDMVKKRVNYVLSTSVSNNGLRKASGEGFLRWKLNRGILTNFLQFAEKPKWTDGSWGSVI